MRDDRLYLIHMSESIETIVAYTLEGREVFMASKLIQDAVIRNFEVLGEAAKHVSDAFKAEHPELPWKQVAGFRDVLIHDYMGVDLERIWAGIEGDLPPLRASLSSILSKQ